MLNGIKNLVFDLGNVIIDLDIDRTFVQLGHWMGDEYLKGVPMGVFESFEVGAISEEEFFGALRGATPHAVGVHRFRDAWNAMLLSIPYARLEMLERLKRDYRVFLLSNTNVTHLRWVHGYLDVMHGVRDFETRFFHGAYYSHLVGLRKPNVDIFEFVLRDAGLVAGETLFIDDSEGNVLGAREVGIRGYLHPIGAEVIDLFRNVIQ